MSEKLVTVFGGGRVAAESPLYRDCALLGRLLAEAGFLVATGGYYGSMEAVLQGAAQAGGRTVGFTCSIFDGALRPNGWVHEERKTTSMPRRIERMAVDSDAFVVVHGGLGTLAELALVWDMILTGEVRARPFVVVGAEWPRVVESIHQHTQMGSSALKLLTLVDTPHAAVGQLRAALSNQLQGDQWMKKSTG